MRSFILVVINPIRSMKKSTFRNIVLSGFALASTLFFFNVPVQAQSQLPPPISPWLSMFNYNRGNALSNYHTYVVPQQQAQKAYQSQQTQIRKQAAQQQVVQGEVEKILNQPRKVGSGASRSAGGYGQYLHYYQGGVSSRPVPQFSSPGRR